MNFLKQQNLLVIDAFQDIGIELAVSLANLGSNIVLNGSNSPSKIQEAIVDISNLGVQSFHHGSNITDYGEVEILLDDSERLLGSLDLIVILITSKNFKLLSCIIEHSILRLGQRDRAKLVCIFLFDDYLFLENCKAEIDNYCNEKVKNYKNLRYLSIRQKEIPNVNDTAALILE